MGEFEKYEDFTIRPDYFLFKTLNEAITFLAKIDLPLTEKMQLYPLVVYNVETTLVGTGKIDEVDITDMESNYNKQIKEFISFLPTNLSEKEREVRIASFKLRKLMMKTFLIEENDPTLGV